MKKIQTACLLWEGSVNSGGYPITWHQGRIAYAHRVIAQAKKGEVVMHICDTPRCVNPEHLLVGTAKQNSEDMVAKGRQAFGERAGSAKLTWAIVSDIRKERGSLSSRKVAIKYNISKTNVLDIWNNNIWKV